MSERLLGAVVGMHGDDAGLIIPPAIAPFQIVLMPIASHIDENVDIKIKEISSILTNNGFRIKIDDRDVRPGVKHYDWEIKGVPLRLELGPRDLKEGQCIISLRTGGKRTASIENLVESITQLLEEISDELRIRASKMIDAKIMELPNVIEDDGELRLSEKIKTGYIYELAFDGSDSDAEKLEKLTGLTLLGIANKNYSDKRKCSITGKLTNNRAFIGRMY